MLHTTLLKSLISIVGLIFLGNILSGWMNMHYGQNNQDSNTKIVMNNLLPHLIFIFQSELAWFLLNIVPNTLSPMIFTVWLTYGLYSLWSQIFSISLDDLIIFYNFQVCLQHWSTLNTFYLMVRVSDCFMDTFDSQRYWKHKTEIWTWNFPYSSPVLFRPRQKSRRHNWNLSFTVRNRVL